MSAGTSRNNSLLSRSGPAFIIEFEPEPTSQRHCIRASDTTIRWYNDMASRKVQYLQLCKEGTQYFTVITMEDGSVFQLKFMRSKNSNNPRNVCSLFRLSEHSRILSMCLFSLEGVGDIACPVSDMKFIIAICLPLCQRLDPAQASHGTLFALALATAVARRCVEIKSDTLTFTRTPLDNFWREIILSSKPTDQPLWEGAIADGIRDQVRNWVVLKAREHVAEFLFQHEQGPELSGDRQDANANSTAPENNPPTIACPNVIEPQGLVGPSSVQYIHPPADLEKRVKSSVIDERKRISATSIVAWLEFWGTKQSAHSLARWETTWNSTWEREWDKAWVNSRTKQQGEHSLKVKPSQFTDHIPTTSGRASGKISCKIPIDTNIMFELMVKMPTNSLLQWEYEHVNQLRYSQDATIGHCRSEIATPNNKEVMWFKSWRSLRYPNPPDSWCPSWELAVIMAWVLRWEKAVDAGQRLHAQGCTASGSGWPGRQIVAGPITTSPIGSQTQLSNVAPQAGRRVTITTIALTERTRTEPRPTLFTERDSYPHTSLLNVTQLLSQMRTRYLKRVFEQPDIASQANQYSGNGQRNPAYLLDKAVDFAWDIALKTPGSPESNLSNSAASAFHLATKNFSGHVPNRTSTISKERWEQVFKQVWESTWKQCWRESWTEVMKAAERTVMERGIQEGISCARDADDWKFAQQAVSFQSPGESISKFEPTVILAPRAREQLEILGSVMLHIDLLEDYRRCIPALFVSLEQLYQATKHSGPVIHPKLEIKIFEEKPLLQAIAYAKTKTKALWDQTPEEVSFQTISHSEFQSKIRSIIEDIPEKQSQIRGDSAIKWMTDVWHEAVAIPSSIDQDLIPEISEPDHVFRSLPRSPTSYKHQRADRPDFSGESHISEDAQNNGARSIFRRLFHHKRTVLNS